MAAAFAKAVLAEIPPKSAAPSAGVKPDLTDQDNSCLQALWVTDPETERRRIEATKGGLLDDSFRWVLDNAQFRKWHSNRQSQLLWLKGDPGKGKTMLMIGIIDEMLRQIQSQPSQSIAYFLCQATDSKLNNATSILRSLIYMLIRQQPQLISYLREKYDTDPKLFESGNAFHSLSGIFEKMIQNTKQATTYLFIDALDECGTDLSDLLKLIARTNFMSATQVKWMVSSRNRDDIEQELQTKLSLELNANQISNAVVAYINHRVSRLKALQHNAFLLEQVKEQLLQKSDGTFLWVALVVQDMQKCQQSAAMVELLEKSPPGLTPLYDRMLQQIQLLEGLDRELCILVLSIVTLGYRPLHLRELCRLADLHKQQYGLGDLENIVGMCGSFLTVRDEIFRESLKDLSAKLRRNIYDIADPGISSSEIATFRPDPDPLFDLRYSCTYWLNHLLEAISTSTDKINSRESMAIFDFFKKHLLHWLESLSLIGEMRCGILALRKLVHHKAVFKEFERFATSYGSIIQDAPLQAYSAAVVFCPQASESKKLYWGERLDFLEHAFVMQDTWDPCMQIPDGHTDQVMAVAFSPDGQTLASASYDGTIHLWDPAKGLKYRTWPAHTDWVHAVAFSPDGKSVMSASDDATVRVWNPLTGLLRCTLRGHMYGVSAVAFSPDGQTIASAGYDSTVYLWDPATEDPISGFAIRRALLGHEYRCTAVAFSPDGQTVVSGSEDKTVRLWDPATGIEHCTLKGHTDTVTAVAISPDGKTVASASEDKTVRLWDPATGVETDKYQLDVVLKTLSFSANGCLNTDRGLLSLNQQPSNSFIDRREDKLFVHEKWVTRNGQRLIWLPPEYRATCVVTSGNSVVLGHKSGLLTFLWLS